MSKIIYFWVILKTLLFTIELSVTAVIKSILGTITREWVNFRIRKWSKKLLEIINVNLTVFNPYGINIADNQKYIIMVNHASHYDIPITFVAMPGTIRMLAKKELFKIPFFGAAMRRSEFPSINRQDRKQAIKDLAIVKERMETGISIWMAPEGTRSRTGELGEFKKGGFITAIQAQAKIIPVGIKGAREILPADTLRFKLNQDIEFHIGEPIDAAEYTMDNKEELMARTREVMQALIA